MYCQGFADKINICLSILFDFLYLYCLISATGNALWQFPGYAYAIVAARIQIRNEIGKYRTKGTGYGAGLTTGAAHFVPLQDSVRLFLQSIMITGANAGGFFAFPAIKRKGGVLPQTGYAVVLRVIEIAALHHAFRAPIANL